MIMIRREAPWHRGAREALLDRALGPQRQSKSSENLRRGRLPELALVAQDGATLTGSLRLWAVSEESGARTLLLGPLAVEEDLRDQGVGGRLMRAALNWAAVGQYDAIVLVGDLAYYSRFGFEGGLGDRLTMPGSYDPQRLLGLELQPGTLASLQGELLPAGEFDPVAADIAALAALPVATALRPRFRN